MDSRVQWAHLLPELLSRIAECLENGTAIRQFRAVCRSWRSSCNLPPNLLSLHFPCKIPSISGPFGSQSNPRKLAVISCSFYLVVPCQDLTSRIHPVPWLVQLQESNPGNLTLRSILLPHDLPKPNNIDLLRFRVTELAKSYHFTRRRLYDEAIYKVVLLSNPKSNDFAALMLSKSGVFAVRSRKEGWEQIKFVQASLIDDIVSFKGYVCAVDNRGCLYKISKTLQVDTLAEPISDHDYGMVRKRLVESNQELYLVEFDLTVQVYKLDEGKCSWCSVDSIGDRTLLFVTTDCCFFASSEAFPRLKGNGMVFHFRSFCWYMVDHYRLHERLKRKRWPDRSCDDSGSLFNVRETLFYIGLGDERDSAELIVEDDSTVGGYLI